MTSNWDAYKLDIPMQLPMEMAMVMPASMMNCSKRKPPSMQPSQVEADAIIRDFTEITVSNSDNVQGRVRFTSRR
jgi:hypothetical protein